MTERTIYRPQHVTCYSGHVDNVEVLVNVDDPDDEIVLGTCEGCSYDLTNDNSPSVAQIIKQFRAHKGVREGCVVDDPGNINAKFKGKPKGIVMCSPVDLPCDNVDYDDIPFFDGHSEITEL